jgi:tRNA nucleotidyltransferase (CCA-adding enzyme)
LTPGPRLPDASLIPALARDAAARGGRLLLVGGWVRDQLRGEDSKDLDAEIFGLSQDAISEMLEGFGSIGRVGQHFPVWRLRHRPLDIGYPRDGALEYQADQPASLETAFRAAARHRDLTLNAIAWDPLDARCIDPWNGIADLRAKRLRAVDPATFGSDPVRGLRVARLRARLDAEVEPGTLALCRALDLSSLPVERITGELRRMLIEPVAPSKALRFLDESGLIEALPALAALRGVPQDPRWHPEGDVFVHTCLVVDCARAIGRELEAPAREILQWAAVAHDLGKPATTQRDGDRIRALGHEALGAKLASEWLDTLRVAHQIVAAVEVLVAHHLAPAQFVSQGAGPRAYRRLARKLAAGGMTPVDLERLARADHLGRTTEEARAGRFEAGDAFLEAARAEGVASGVQEDLVSARRLMERGLRPGPMLGRALARAREIQDERGGQGPEAIVESVLEEFAEELGATPPDERTRT